MRRGSVAAAALVSLALCAVAVLVLFGLGFGVMTDCTNNFSCGSDGCDPCSTPRAWLNGGLISIGLTFLTAVALPFAASRGLSNAMTRMAAVMCLVAPVAVVAVVAVAAPRSYCNDPDELTVSGEANYCNG